MQKTAKIILIIVGTILLLNGIINIIDDSMILAYDITSVLSGIGFMVVGVFKKA